MLKNRILFLLLVLLTLNSCVPTKDLIYLQEKSTVDGKVSEAEKLTYRFQSNDILSIRIKTFDPKFTEIFSVSSQEQMGMSEQGLYYNGYSIDDQGNIRMPLLGLIQVKGSTAEEVRQKIENKLLAEYLKPESGIFVSVKLSGFRYTINGEVGKTGTITLYQDKVNIMEAIANAGDIAVTGDRKDVKIIRRFSEGSKTFSMDLTKAEAINSPGFNLQPNDYIYVKPLKQKSWGTGKTGIESLSTIITIMSLATTTFLLLKR